MDSDVSRPDGQPSWKAEVEVQDEPDRWHSNALRFATREEAGDYAADLSHRWLLVTRFRVAESEDPVNYRFANGVLLRLEGVQP